MIADFKIVHPAIKQTGSFRFLWMASIDLQTLQNFLPDFLLSVNLQTVGNLGLCQGLQLLLCKFSKAAK